MLNKKYILLFITLLVAVTLASKRSYKKLDQNIIVSVFQPIEPIVSLNSKRDFDNFSAYYIDQLSFPRDKELAHYKLGRLGFQKNLHLDIEMWVDVLVEGEYEFYFFTDNGIGIRIDDSAIYSNIFLDQFRHINLKCKLSKGQHKIALSKIHRNGVFLIEARYRLKGTETYYNIGESSDSIKFIELDLWN